MAHAFQFIWQVQIGSVEIPGLSETLPMLFSGTRSASTIDVRSATPDLQTIMTSKITNGKSLQPLSGATPRQIVLLLHGYGSDGADLIAMAEPWRRKLSDALFLAPNAPQACPTGRGYQWWPLTAFSPASLAAGAAQAAPAIDTFIDRKLGRYGLTEADLAIVGFSQGTMMALHVGLRRVRSVAGIVGYSGALTGGKELAGQIVSRPPVLLIHGAADRVVPPAALDVAQRTLSALGVNVQTHISPGVGHHVDHEGIELGADFVAQHFGI